VNDPDAATPLSVRIDVDGVAGKPFLTTATDTAGTFSFNQTMKLPPGAHRIDVYVLDQPPGTPVLFVRQLVGFTPVSGTLISARPRQLTATVTSRTGSAFVRLDVDGQIGALTAVKPGNVVVPVPALPTGSHHLVLNLIDPITLDTTALFDNSIIYA
jgi:hypothetical protein